MKRIFVPSLLLVLAFGLVACEPLPTGQRAQQTLAFEKLAQGDSIPLDYGRLVAVTSIEDRPFEGLLWFERENHEIVLVRVNISVGSMAREVLVIPRK